MALKTAEVLLGSEDNNRRVQCRLLHEQEPTQAGAPLSALLLRANGLC